MASGFIKFRFSYGSGIEPGKQKIKHKPLVNSLKVYLLSLFIKLGLMNGMDKIAVFPEMKEKIFLCLEIRQLLKYSQIIAKLNPAELAVCLSFKNW
ncbi:hypothetical protein C0J52_16778 [Blattella germanica]|nr:hypothetical protein C0J52_16778 [Blattella germanica]